MFAEEAQGIGQAQHGGNREFAVRLARLRWLRAWHKKQNEQAEGARTRQLHGHRKGLRHR